MHDTMLGDRIVWLDGSLVAARNAKVSALSPAAQFGISAFEGLRAYWSDQDGVLYGFRFHDHFDRLNDSCRIVGLGCDYSPDRLLGIVREVVDANHYLEDLMVRVVIFVDGDGTWHSLTPTVLMVAPVARRRMNLNVCGGLAAQISSWSRIDDRSMPPRAKVGANYLNSRYAMLEARRNGYDVPIMLGTDGKISESSGACLFMVRHGILTTPPVTGSVLEGITRETVLILARDMGLEVEVRPIDRTELYVADEAFLCGTSAELSPLSSVDRQVFGDGSPGNMTRSLLVEYQAAASNMIPQYGCWTTALAGEE